MKITKSINVQEPWFDYIKNKQKTIEGRLNKGIFSELNVGDEIIINKKKNDMTIDYVEAKIIRITKYKSFEEYLSQEGLRRTLPGINTIEDGENIYYKFYTKQDEEKYGILAIRIVLIDMEPQIVR